MHSIFFSSDNKPDIDTVDNRKISVLDVEFVTEENIKNVSINDIVLPLPGHSVTYPKNESKFF